MAVVEVVVPVVQVILLIFLVQEVVQEQDLDLHILLLAWLVNLQHSQTEVQVVVVLVPVMQMVVMGRQVYLLLQFLLLKQQLLLQLN